MAQLTANAALCAAAAHPLERRVVVGCIKGGRARDVDFERAFTGGLATLALAERGGGLGGITGHVAESVVEVVLADHGWTPIWHFIGPGGHGVDLLFLDPERTRVVTVEVKGTLRAGRWPRLRRSELTQMESGWLDKRDNPAMKEWELAAADIVGAVAVVNFADVAYKVALTGDFAGWHPIDVLEQLDDLAWLAVDESA